MSRNERYLPEEDPTLHGIVTPLKQMKRGSMDKNLTFHQLYQDKNLFSKFKSTEFPKIEVMSDANYFFQPVHHTMFNMHTYVMKWFCLTPDFKIPHDHNYTFARMNMNGYLMKITIPKLSDVIDHFEINYVLPLSDVQFEQIMLPGKDKTDAEEIYVIPSFDLHQYPKVTEMVQKNNFKDKYLQDAFY